MFNLLYFANLFTETELKTITTIIVVGASILYQIYMTRQILIENASLDRDSICDIIIQQIIEILETMHMPAFYFIFMQDIIAFSLLNEARTIEELLIIVNSLATLGAESIYYISFFQAYMEFKYIQQNLVAIM